MLLHRDTDDLYKSGKHHSVLGLAENYEPHFKARCIPNTPVFKNDNKGHFTVDSTAFLAEKGRSVIDVLIPKIIGPSEDRKSRSQITIKGKLVECCTVTSIK